VKYWEIIADNLSEAVGAWVKSQPLILKGERVDAHRDDGKRLVCVSTKSSARLLNLKQRSHLR